MMTRVLTIEWKIYDTRDENGGFRRGTSKLITTENSYVKMFNEAIKFAANLPTWELERNGIDLNDYRDEKYSRYYDKTEISKIIKIENVK